MTPPDRSIQPLGGSSNNHANPDKVRPTLIQGTAAKCEPAIGRVEPMRRQNVEADQNRWSFP